MFLFGKNPINLTQKILLFFGLNLFLITVVSILQHNILGTPFMMERFAVFLYPIFILMISFLIIDLLSFSYKYITRGVLILLTTLFFWHTCFSLNVNWYYKWRCEGSTNEMLADMAKIKQENPSAQITLGVDWMFLSTFEFYIKKYKWDWVTLDYNAAIMHNNEYFYIMGEAYNRFPPDQFQIVKYYKLADTYFVKYVNNPKSKTTIQLKAANNEYVCAETNVVANRDKPGAWETFTLFSFGNKQCAICSYKNTFLAPELVSKGEVTSTRTDIGAWETFTVLKVSDDTVAFKASNNKYLSFDKKTFQIFANADAIGVNEKFKIIIVNKADF